MIHSCLYEGTVRHRRFAPIWHEFTYRLFMVYLDLDEVESLLGRRGLWSSRWPALARFCRKDYLGDQNRPLADCIRELVEREAGWRPRGRIYLLTNLRFLGFQMNPVSFYYCYSESGDALEAVVAEVTNTPWKERHCYVADVRSRAEDRPCEAEHAKVFHVSPFLPMDLQYRWQFTVPHQKLNLNIDALNRDHEKQFDAMLTLSRRPLSRWQRMRALACYPFMTWKVCLAIYWQAFRLWRKGVPFVPHPKTSALTGQK